MARTMDDERFQPFLTALGRVATGWAEYEHLVNTMIWDLSNIERFAGSCLTSQLIGSGPRFRCLLSLLKIRGAQQEIIGAFNSHSSEAEKIGRQRNRALHDPLLLNYEKGTIARMEITADRNLKHQIVDAEVSELLKLDEKISVLTKDFDSLYDRALVELPSWTRTQFEQSPGIARHRTNQKNSGAE